MMNEEELRQQIIAQQQQAMQPQLNMATANMPMPNPPMGGGFGGLMRRAGTGLQNGLGQLSQGMFPMDPQATQGMDPSQIQALRSNAMMQMGLGMMAASRRPGASVGSSLAAGFGGAQANLHGALQQGFENAKANNAERRQLERDKTSDERFDKQLTYQQEQDKLRMEQERTQQEALQKYRDQEIQLQQAGQKQQMEIAKLRSTGLAQAPAGYEWQVAPDGERRLKIIPGGPADPSVGKGKVTDTERLAAAYAGRMKAAASDIDKMDYRPSATDLKLFTIMSGEPGYQASAANSMLSPKAQQYFQSLQDFSRAKLRKESGAVISKEEIYGDLATFFPLPGDSEAVVKQKKEARQTALDGMIGTAGPAMPKEPAPLGSLLDKYAPL